MILNSEVNIYFELDKNQGYGDDTKSLWAKEISQNKYKIQSIPAFAFGISLNDVVSVRQEGNTLFFDGIITRGGHSTYRLLILNSHDSSVFEKHWNTIVETRCTYEGIKGPPKVIAINVPPSVNIYQIYSIL